MNVKYIKLGIGLGFFALSLSVLGWVIFKGSQKVELERKAESLPYFLFRTSEGNWIDKHLIPDSDKVWVARLNAICGSCWAQLDVFCRMSSEIENSDIQLLIVVDGEMEQAQQVKAELQSAKCLSKAHVLVATDREFEKYFGNSAAPSLYCYNEDWVLEAKFKGAVKGSLLQKQLESL